MVGQSELGLQGQAGPASISALLYPGAPELAASKVPTVTPAPKVAEGVLAPWAERELGVPWLTGWAFWDHQRVGRIAGKPVPLS